MAKTPANRSRPFVDQDAFGGKESRPGKRDRKTRGKDTNVIPFGHYTPGAAVEDNPGVNVFKPANAAQRKYLNTIRANQLTFGIGPAGTGKTFVCTSFAAEEFKANRLKRIIVTRPAVEASGKGLGFLPGTIEEKFAPYFEPFRRVLLRYFNESDLDYKLKRGQIEIAPLEYLRGLTFEDAFVILDEAQNTTPAQMKLFLTRIGETSKVVIDGDIDQQDIKGLSGLQDAMNRLADCPDVGFFEFQEKDIVRSGLVREILVRYRSKPEA